MIVVGAEWAVKRVQHGGGDAFTQWCFRELKEKLLSLQENYV
jgi:hypothetical protein